MATCFEQARVGAFWKRAHVQRLFRENSQLASFFLWRALARTVGLTGPRRKFIETLTTMLSQKEERRLYII